MASDVVDDLRFKLEAHHDTIRQLEKELSLAKAVIDELRKDPHERRRLPDDRKSVTYHLAMTTAFASWDLYLIVGLYDDGRPGEIFVRAAKMGSTVSGFLDAWAVAASLLLQRGESIEKICEKYRRQRFEPGGHVVCGDLKFGATSLIDAVVHVLENAYVKKKEEAP